MSYLQAQNDADSDILCSNYVLQSVVSLDAYVDLSSTHDTTYTGHLGYLPCTRARPSVLTTPLYRLCILLDSEDNQDLALESAPVPLEDGAVPPRWHIEVESGQPDERS